MEEGPYKAYVVCSSPNTGQFVKYADLYTGVPEIVGPRPKISDTTPKVGQKLKAKIGVWSPWTATLTYRWYRKSRAGKVYRIGGATEPTYRVAEKYRKNQIRVKVTGALEGVEPVTMTSKWTARVK